MLLKLLTAMELICLSFLSPKQTIECLSDPVAQEHVHIDFTQFDFSHRIPSNRHLTAASLSFSQRFFHQTGIEYSICNHHLTII